MSDDYPWDVGRSEDERMFLLELRRLANDTALFDAWTLHPQLVVTLSIGDPVEKAILRTLRVDFDGRSLVGGNDRSHQITESELNPGPPYPEDLDYFELPGEFTPPELAQRAFDWFQRQASRPIDRLEWDGPEHGWTVWSLADPGGEELVARYTNRPGRPPDRVIRLKSPIIS